MNNRRLLGKVIAVGLLCVPPALKAEIHQCDGKWTNLPCSGTVEKEIKEAQRSRSAETVQAPVEGAPSGASPASPVLEPLAPRSELARKLRKLSDEYKGKGGVMLSQTELDGFRRYCEERLRTLAECQTRFTEQSQRLIELNQKRDKLELDAERNKIEADKVKAIRGY